jgi:hypothetical protein
VTSEISIDGGAAGITMTRNASAAPTRLRHFLVAPGGNLTLTRFTLTGGLLATAYFGFSYRACGIGGASFDLNGSIVATNTTISRNQVNEWWG